MALWLKARVETSATVSGTGNVTSIVANSSRIDFSAMPDGDYTYGYLEQGTLWEECRLTKSGTQLVRSNVTASSSGGSSVSFDGAAITTVFIDVPLSFLLVKNSSGGFDNADPLLASVALSTLAALKAVTLPGTSGLALYVRGLASATDGKGAWYYWDSAEGSAGDDYSYVVSNNSATGRWVRVKQQLDPATAANDGAISTAALARVSGDLRSKHATKGARAIPEVVNYFQASYATLAAFKAAASSQWVNGDLIELRGVTAEGDVRLRSVGTWQSSNTNTTDLDKTHVRPDDISGGNQGRLVFPFDINLTAGPKLFEFTGDGSLVNFDIARQLSSEDFALVFYDGLPVDKADYSVTVDTPANGQTRFTFGFTPANGVKIKIFA